MQRDPVPAVLVAVMSEMLRRLKSVDDVEFLLRLALAMAIRQEAFSTGETLEDVADRYGRTYKWILTLVPAPSPKAIELRLRNEVVGLLQAQPEDSRDLTRHEIADRLRESAAFKTAGYQHIKLDTVLANLEHDLVILKSKRGGRRAKYRAATTSGHTTRLEDGRQVIEENGYNALIALRVHELVEREAASPGFDQRPHKRTTRARGIRYEYQVPEDMSEDEVNEYLREQNVAALDALEARARASGKMRPLTAILSILHDKLK